MWRENIREHIDPIPCHSTFIDDNEANHTVIRNIKSRINILEPIHNQVNVLGLPSYFKNKSMRSNKPIKQAIRKNKAKKNLLIRK